ncbi:hypothetical protein GCM10007079_25250 [Nocardiopsis terrae]|uniref:Uncharacterized protein n=1 Tax=Nocardiopsis terrae TaxID=372655 RepID=A0ABR9HFS8_9ACTN|nr:hypothetical protein [Nocardiopsis terrae]MBE1457870.1 hypothetical protein [Nocardiopsis terrae]GHC83814.1 hypothetical protein GCM10007079_25250 [Nocardiopsis terrae]
MKRIDSGDVEFLDDVTARLPGGSLIGQLIEMDGKCADVQTFIKGYTQGPSFLIGETGSILEYSNRIGNHAIGPRFTWDSGGNLREERVDDFSDGTVRLLRTWDDQGVLVYSETKSPQHLFVAPDTGENQFRPWRDVPANPDAPGVGGYIEAPLMRNLVFGDLIAYEGDSYTGEAIRVLESGATELHTFVEGLEDGPF